VLGGGPAQVLGPTAVADCRKRFDELLQGNIDWGSPGRGFFDLDEWEKEPPPHR
jgi:hypothetical protein